MIISPSGKWPYFVDNKPASRQPKCFPEPKPSNNHWIFRVRDQKFSETTRQLPMFSWNSVEFFQSYGQYADCNGRALVSVSIGIFISVCIWTFHEEAEKLMKWQVDDRMADLGPSHREKLHSKYIIIITPHFLGKNLTLSWKMCKSILYMFNM